jgi:hypothetical protein
MFPRGTDTKLESAQRTIRLSLFLGLLLVAAYLRIAGLTWGLESGYGHALNYQPDEFVSLRGVLEIDLLRGQLKAPSAYFEGTFNYYLWAIPKAVLDLLKTAAPSTVSIDEQNYTDLLYACRWMSVLFDLCTVVIIFLAIREATAAFYPSLLGALCYAVLPMQVIYAHFMRTHLLSNLLCALVIWISLKFRSPQRWWTLLTAGLISGVGAAARYPVGIIAVIPCLYVLLDQADNLPNWRLRIWQGATRLVAGPIWLIGAGVVIGLFLGHPMLFLDSWTVINAFTDETLKYASLREFNSSNLLNLSVVWSYVVYLIPFAMYPFLWLVFYCAILYLGFRCSLYRQSIPIFIFSLLYLYFMAKGYLGPWYARAAMPLFPGFCLLVGIACNDLWLLLKRQRTAIILLASVFLFVIGSSAFFDVAYVQAMQEKDSRSTLRKDLRKIIGTNSVTIGFSGLGVYFYTTTPAVEPLKSEKVKIQLQDAGQKADFFLLGWPGQMDPEQLNATIREIEGQGVFRYEKSYNVRPRIFGREFQLTQFPQDMTYPFPTILLFRAKAKT